MKRYTLPCFLLVLPTLPLGVLAQGSKVTVETDARIELLSAALSQSAWAPSLNGYFSPYAQDAQRTFFPHRSHAAVKRLDSLRGRGIALRDLFRWVFTRGPLPDLAAQGAAEISMADAAGGAVALDRLAAELVDFAKASDFESFQKRNASALTELADECKNRVKSLESLVVRSEQYSGVPGSRYRVLVAPMLGNSVVSWSDWDRQEVCILASPTSFRGGKLSFDGITTTGLLLAISRAIAGEVVKSNQKRVGSHEDWYGYLEEPLRRLGVANWSETVRELIAVSLAVRLLELDGHTSEAAELKRSRTARGLFWLPYVLPRLSDYERDRAKFPDLVSFGPKLFDALDELEPVLAGGEPGDLGLADVGLTDEGVPVLQVDPGSLGAKAGIRKGDIIQSIAGVRINGSESYLKAWDRWERAANNEAVPFRVKRGNATMLLSVVMKRIGAFQGFRKRPATP